ncbi:Complexin [Halotydeus destructor]|nr:Complexin [Halotydeus destructor]
MAAFIAKQMIGNQLSAVKDVGGGGESDEDKEKAAEMERERLEALAETERQRKEKHAKMEREREGMRQQVRDKYGIKNKEEKEAEKLKQQEELMGGPLTTDGGLNRAKKTPEELAAEADQDDFTKLKNSLETQVNEIKTNIEGKCSIQ